MGRGLAIPQAAHNAVVKEFVNPADLVAHSTTSLRDRQFQTAFSVLWANSPDAVTLPSLWPAQSSWNGIINGFHFLGQAKEMLGALWSTQHNPHNSYDTYESQQLLP